MTPLARVLPRALAVAYAAAAACPPFSIPWPQTNGSTTCQPAAQASDEALSWLRANAPPYDLENADTLFGAPGGVDGLEFGVAAVAANLTLDARAEHAWAAAVPQDVFNDYVLPYACANEPRTNWPQLMQPVVSALVDTLPENASITEVAAQINGYGTNASNNVWQSLGGITFKSSQTPLVFDPVSTAAFGHASCTGVSVTFVAALRAAGVPARLVGTPAWEGDPDNGNHNWVEIWRETNGGEWSFVEAKPAGGGETLDNPCDKWFCNAAHFPAASGPNQTMVYAARFDRTENASIYPLAWDLANRDVPGVDRSADYYAMCSEC